MRAALIVITLAALALTLAGILPGEIVWGIALVCGIFIFFSAAMSAGALLTDKNERR
jgi:hypothetical protein